MLQIAVIVIIVLLYLPIGMIPRQLSLTAVVPMQVVDLNLLHQELHIFPSF